jgi:hypothetical protein
MMHLCNPEDTQPCGAWCVGTTHVDLAYCTAELLEALPSVVSFRQWHAAKHATAYATPPCTIIALQPVLEAPSAHERYAHAGTDGRARRAFRVTYQVVTPGEAR